jgi:dGTPase
LFENVYLADDVEADFEKASKLLKDLFEYFMSSPQDLTRCGGRRNPEDSLAVSAADFLAGMTDRFAINLYHKLFLPQPWKAF